MQYILTGTEMQLCDANTTAHYKMPSIVLMERAAFAFVEELKQRQIDTGHTLILCGSGNNGGDGMAVARLLALDGQKVTVVYAGNPAHATEQNSQQRQILEAYGILIHEDVPEGDYSLVIDAVFGVGLSRPVEGSYAALLAKANEMGGIKVALDIASGVNADDGQVLGEGFHADLTFTFAFLKRGQLLYPGSEYSGSVVCLPMGIDEHGFLEQKPPMAALEQTDLKLLPRRRAYSNKGTYGKLLLIAGSVGMAGAAVLAARAAYAAGCGYVRVVTPSENRVILQTAVPEAVLTFYDADHTDDLPWEELFAWADGIVAGPGLGTSDTALMLMRRVLSQKHLPLVLDADALNLLARHRELLLGMPKQTIVTPHLGEMARLARTTVDEIQKALADTASWFAEEYRAVCVLKDARTITALPEGGLYINCSGNDGMAVAGSGDVLSGIIGSLLVQKLPASMAAPLGVYVHGMAGDLMAVKIGKAGLAASDLVEGVKMLAKELGR